MVTKRATLLLLPLLFLAACQREPTPPPPSPPVSSSVPKPKSPPPAPAPTARRATTDSKGVIEPRTVTSSRDPSGEIREVHKRSDGTVALEATYEAERAVRVRALAASGTEAWACDLREQGRAPTCVVRDDQGTPLSAEALATRNYDARKRLEAAHELLAPPDDHDDHDHAGHSHFKLPPPSKEAQARWQAKRAEAWAEAEPWFERVEALRGLGLPVVVATGLAKEELSSGFWIVPKKAPIGPDADHHDH